LIRKLSRFAACDVAFVECQNDLPKGGLEKCFADNYLCAIDVRQEIFKLLVDYRVEFEKLIRTSEREAKKDGIEADFLASPVVAERIYDGGKLLLEMSGECE